VPALLCFAIGPREAAVGELRQRPKCVLEQQRLIEQRIAEEKEKPKGPKTQAPD